MEEIKIIKEPEDMGELLYFSNRAIGEGKARAWVYKVDCPECGKAKMGKPKNPKTGKVKIRSTEYQCPECEHTEEKVAHEEALTLEAKYTCPECKKEGEGSCLYKRKSFQGVKAYILTCEHCEAKIPITKKMKDPKKKKKK